MKNPHLKSALGVLSAAFVLTILAACSISTANLSSLKLGKDKDVTTEASTFGPHDTVYALATVSNSGSKTTVKFQVFMEKVEGNPDNTAIPGVTATVDLPSSGTADYHLSPNADGAGLPVGKYRIEALMLDENGAQKDMKSATFTVAAAH